MVLFKPIHNEKVLRLNYYMIRVNNRPIEVNIVQIEKLTMKLKKHTIKNLQAVISVTKHQEFYIFLLQIDHMMARQHLVEQKGKSFYSIKVQSISSIHKTQIIEKFKLMTNQIIKIN